MPLLTAVIITHNEERNIGRCLASLQGVADEVVVVDSGSSDATEEICRQYGARFFRKDWSGYSDQKNYANGLAAHDWIFSIDADEALSEPLRQSILKAKHGAGAPCLRICRLTNYCGTWIRHSGWYPDVKVRFFDRRRYRWEGLIHERINVTDERSIPLLAGDCHHYTYYTRAEHLAQAERFSALSARDMFERGRRPGWLKVVFGPGFRFFKMFFLQLGFLDGRAGWAIARISARAVRIKYNKLRELYAQRQDQS